MNYGFAVVFCFVLALFVYYGEADFIPEKYHKGRMWGSSGNLFVAAILAGVLFFIVITGLFGYNILGAFMPVLVYASAIMANRAYGKAKNDFSSSIVPAAWSGGWMFLGLWLFVLLLGSPAIWGLLILLIAPAITVYLIFRCKSRSEEVVLPQGDRVIVAGNLAPDPNPVPSARVTGTATRTPSRSPAPVPSPAKTAPTGSTPVPGTGTSVPDSEVPNSAVSGPAAPNRRRVIDPGI